MRGRVAILEKLNAPLTIEEVQIPSTLESGQVLVQVYYSGICGAQLGEISGAGGFDYYLPHLMGHEGGGVVIKTGPGVARVKEGNHVVMHWRLGRGIEAPLPRYKRDDGSFAGAGSVTTFNEYAVVSENRLTPIEESIPLDIAALMGCAVTTGLGLVNNEARLKIGQSIAVAGCGGVGLSVIQGAAMVSANPIIAIDRQESKFQIATELGATDFYTGVASLRKAVDVFVDCTGDPEVIAYGLYMTIPGGKMILVGQPRQDESLILKDFRRNYCGKTIFDSQGGLTDPSTDIPRYLALYRAGKLKLDKLITHRFPLEKVNEALDVVRTGEAVRCVLEMPWAR